MREWREGNSIANKREKKKQKKKTKENDELRVCSAKNMLKLNDSISEIVLIGSPYQIQSVQSIQVQVGGHCVVSSWEVWSMEY